MLRSFKTPILALLLLAAFALPAMTQHALAHDREQKRTLSLSATGAVKTTPDRVDITTGVTSEAPTAREALDKNTEAMTAIVQALKAEGIEAKDIQTVNFTVMPVYEQFPPDGKPRPAPRITGYRVINQVRILVRDTGKLGGILDKVVSLGANTIDSIAFDVSEPDQLRNEARKLAVQNALANAKVYAEAAGVTLGPILSISEDESGPVPFGSPAVARMEMAKDVPLEAGTATVETRIRVTWELQ
jgi:uncharacterized protein YggE